MYTERYHYNLVGDTLQPYGNGLVEHEPNNLGFRRTTGQLAPLNITAYKYSLTNEAKALGLTPGGGTVKVGEIKIDGIIKLEFLDETSAQGVFHFTANYNKLHDALLPRAETGGTYMVIFRQSTEGKWGITAFDRGE
jgi:hypothetical protein